MAQGGRNARQRAANIAVVLVLLIAGVAIGAMERASATTSTLVPVADSYVNSSYPDAVNGAYEFLRADASPVQRSFLKFSLPAGSGNVISARLRLHTRNVDSAASDDGGAVWAVSDTSWSEATLTFNNQPPIDGPRLGQLGAVARNAWYEIDATAAVRDRNSVTFAVVTASTNDVGYDSRELAATAPQLIVTTQSTTTTTSTSTSTTSASTSTTTTPTSTSTSTTSTSTTSTTSSTTSTSTPGSGSWTLAVRAEADSYVNASYDKANNGWRDFLRVDSEPSQRVFMRFAVEGLTGRVVNAKLRLQARDLSSSSTDHGGTLHTVADNTWWETAITWANQPPLGGAIGSIGAVTRNTVYELDVTTAVAGNGQISFALNGISPNDTSYYSREAATGAPQLVITTDGPVTQTTTTTTTTTTTPPNSDDSVTLVGAGDIADCASPGDEATAALLDNIAGTVFTTGDNAYPDATDADFANCYHPSWGRHKARTRPAIGNHEYHQPGAPGYFNYFGAAAGEPGKGYYSYDVGSWHIVVLNSDCGRIGGCHSGSPQETWLRRDLAATTRTCTAAVWHHALFTSGADHPPFTDVRPLVQALYDNRVELGLVGHSHNYERFAPQTPDGTLDTTRGIRQIVIGTGGRDHDSFRTTPAPNSEVRHTGTFGVLKLTLNATNYTWQFIPEAGKTFTDTGTGTCH